MRWEKHESTQTQHSNHLLFSESERENPLKNQNGILYEKHVYKFCVELSFLLTVSFSFFRSFYIENPIRINLKTFLTAVVVFVNDDEM